MQAAHLELALLDDIQLRGGKADVALLDEDVAGVDLARVHLRHNLALHVRLQLVEQQHLAQAVLRA